MTRITKSPEERRKEILDVAEELFLEKGFEETLVSDIVKQIGIAQGTFYYYFASKDEVLYAVLERDLRRTADEIIGISKLQESNPIEKLQLVFKKIFEPKCFNFKINQYITQSQFSQFDQKIDEIRLELYIPVIQGIVEEGIGQKIFSIKYPEEIAEILSMGISGYMNKHLPFFGDTECFEKKMRVLQEILERILNVEEGSFNFIDAFK